MTTTNTPHPVRPGTLAGPGAIVRSGPRALGEAIQQRGTAAQLAHVRRAKEAYADPQAKTIGHDDQDAPSRGVGTSDNGRWNPSIPMSCVGAGDEDDSLDIPMECLPTERFALLVVAGLVTVIVLIVGVAMWRHF